MYKFNASIKSNLLPISCKKLSFFLTKLKNKSYKECLIICKYFPQKIGLIIWKVIFNLFQTKFICNSNNNKLIITKICVSPSSIKKRQRPISKGRTVIIQKKYSFFTIEISELN